MPWERLGAVLGRLESVLGCPEGFWGFLGACWVRHGTSWSAFEPLKSALGGLSRFQTLTLHIVTSKGVFEEEKDAESLLKSYNARNLSRGENAALMRPAH